MSKPTLSTATGRILQAASDLDFIPNPRQRMLKARFLTETRDYPTVDTYEVSCAEALRVTGDQRLTRWWKSPGFKDWFRGKNEYSTRVEYLCQLSLDTAEQILLTDDPRATNAKVALIKALMEAGGKVNRGKEEKLIDEAISKMNRAQLATYIQRASRIKGVPDDDKKKQSERSEEETKSEQPESTE